MACERNSIVDFIKYIESLGIEVNAGKNKARGNKGFFKACGKKYRIDISKDISGTEILKVLVHEFIHYVHYNYDKTLKSVDFLFGSKFDEYEEDLIKLTVESLPKASIEPLFNECKKLKDEINQLSDKIKIMYPDFKLSVPCKQLEKPITHTPCKYLLKYDRVKVFEGFSFKIYSINDLDKDFQNIDETCRLYIKLQSKRRALKRISSKISRLNRYYNNKSELIARSFEYYVTQPNLMKQKTPELYSYYNEFIKDKKNEFITKMISITDR